MVKKKRVTRYRRLDEFLSMGSKPEYRGREEGIEVSTRTKAISRETSASIEKESLEKTSASRKEEKVKHTITSTIVSSGETSASMGEVEGDVEEVVKEIDSYIEELLGSISATRESPLKPVRESKPVEKTRSREAIATKVEKPIQATAKAIEEAETGTVREAIESKKASKSVSLGKEVVREQKRREAIQEITLESLPEIKLPSGKVLEELLKLPVGPERGITCSNEGECSDGRRISEVFVDKYGFRRQRGFIRTTRLPVFLDWIVEEAIVSKVLPTAYKVQTNRGALALIPTDFLCELHMRYGVLLKNYDCRGYRVSIEPIKKKR